MIGQRLRRDSKISPWDNDDYISTEVMPEILSCRKLRKLQPINHNQLRPIMLNQTPHNESILQPMQSDSRLQRQSRNALYDERKRLKYSHQRSPNQFELIKLPLSRAVRQSTDPTETSKPAVWPSVSQQIINFDMTLLARKKKTTLSDIQRLLIQDSHQQILDPILLRSSIKCMSTRFDGNFHDKPRQSNFFRDFITKKANRRSYSVKQGIIKSPDNLY